MLNISSILLDTEFTGNPSQETGKDSVNIFKSQSNGAPEQQRRWGFPLWCSVALVLCAQILALEGADFFVFVAPVNSVFNTFELMFSMILE